MPIALAQAGNVDMNRVLITRWTLGRGTAPGGNKLEDGLPTCWEYSIQGAQAGFYTITTDTGDTDPIPPDSRPWEVRQILRDKVGADYRVEVFCAVPDPVLGGVKVDPFFPLDPIGLFMYRVYHFLLRADGIIAGYPTMNFADLTGAPGGGPPRQNPFNTRIHPNGGVVARMGPVINIRGVVRPGFKLDGVR